ncbi:hypothetical protein CA13_44070 [Planctomycetes bacterium CA13]|uniref:Uncharacterized protein n=1 Tax=Novipirellula herctigrandis TaxID=2527986 RepID=A0A5C5Z6P3_9BACT|nr:hypothetical protein CA13_44070 [Planctomycetes bacterium CA13]
MSQHDPIEKSLRRLTPPQAPASLRVAVLGAIEIQRDSETNVTLAESEKRHWFVRIERFATYAAPCFLLLSLFTFGLVNWSTGKLLHGNHQSVSDSTNQTTDDRSRFASGNPFNSPQAFFRHHLAVLETLNKELFRETTKEIPQVDRDLPPLGRIHRDLDCRVSELASVTPIGNTFGDIA